MVLATPADRFLPEINKVLTLAPCYGLCHRESPDLLQESSPANGGPSGPVASYSRPRLHNKVKAVVRLGRDAFPHPPAT